LTGGDGANYLDGSTGDDTMHATDAGADTLFCGDGAADNAVERDSVDNVVASELT